MIVKKLIFIFFFAATLVACVSKKSGLESTKLLHEDLIKLGYEPIIPPSTILEPGTVIGYIDNVEVIKATRESCSTEFIRKKTHPTQIANKIYTVNSSNVADLTLSELSRYDIDLKALLTLKNIGKVTYQFIAPFIWSVDEITAEKHFKNSPEGCMTRAGAEGNVIIHQVIGAKGLKLAFFDKSDNKITAKAELLELVDANGSSNKVSVENGEIIDDQELFYGYRVFEGFYGAGLSDMEKRNSFYVKYANEKIKQLKKL